MRTFVPGYHPQYGLTRAKWHRLSTPEKLKVIHEHRQQCVAFMVAHNLSAEPGDRFTQPLGFIEPPPFVPYTWKDEMEARDRRELWETGKALVEAIKRQDP